MAPRGNMPITYGCECRGCDKSISGCAGAKAPCIALIERYGVTFRVCSYCILSTDKRIFYLVDEGTDIKPFLEYDPLGALAEAPAFRGEY